jgi:hypothetical protein
VACILSSICVVAGKIRLWGTGRPIARARRVNLWQLTDDLVPRHVELQSLLDLTWACASRRFDRLAGSVGGRRECPAKEPADMGRRLRPVLQIRPLQAEGRITPETGRSVIYYGRTTISLTKP